MGDTKQPSSLDLSRLPPSLVLVLAIAGVLPGTAALGLRFGDPEPPAKAEDVKALQIEVDELERAVLDLSYQIKLHHKKANP